MTSTLEAAEALLATVEAGRARLRALSHQHLPFERSVALEIEGRVGASPERAVLGMSHASLDLVRVASALAAGRIEWAPEPVAAPEPAALEEAAPFDEEATQVAVTPPALAAALADAEPSEPTEPSLDLGADVTLDDLLHDALPEPQRNPFVAPSDDLDEPTDLAPALDPDDEATLMDVASPFVGLPQPVPDPSAEPDARLPATPDPTEEDTAAVVPPDDAEPTTVARRSPELMAAIASPRQVTPSLGLPQGSLGLPQGDRERPRRYDEHPELVEHDGLAEPSTVAAVQLLGGGKATALTPTLELGDAEAAPEDDLDLPEPTSPDGDDFQLGFVEPEEEPAAEADLPQLTAEAGPVVEDSPVVVTRDGVQHRDGAAVADADVGEGELDRLLAEARAAERRGNISQAIEIYDDLLSLQPSNVSAHLGRGRLLIEKGDYAAAMSDFQRSEDLEPANPEPIVEMGNLFFARKEYRKAITYFDQAIEQAPDHAMAWCRRGICYYYRKSYDKAFQDLQKASSLDADIPNLRKYVQMARNAMQRANR